MALKDGRNRVGAGRPRAPPRICSYGPSRLACGPGIRRHRWIILVEGRADVRRLLLAGYENVLAINGAKIDPSIVGFCGSKEKVVAFLDGDHTGALIMSMLGRMVTVDYELRADPNTEVEDADVPRIRELLDPIKIEIEGAA